MSNFVKIFSISTLGSLQSKLMLYNIAKCHELMAQKKNKVDTGMYTSS